MFRTLLATLLLLPLVSAHFQIVYPPWRGNTLKDDMQWNYPCKQALATSLFCHFSLFAATHSVRGWGFQKTLTDFPYRTQVLLFLLARTAQNGPWTVVKFRSFLVGTLVTQRLSSMSTWATEQTQSTSRTPWWGFSKSQDQAETRTQALSAYNKCRYQWMPHSWD